MTRRMLKPRILSFRASILIGKFYFQCPVLVVVFKMMILLRSWKSPRKRNECFPAEGCTTLASIPSHTTCHSGRIIPYHTTTPHHTMYHSGEEGGAQGNSRHFSQSGFFTAAAFFALNKSTKSPLLITHFSSICFQLLLLQSSPGVVGFALTRDNCALDIYCWNLDIYHSLLSLQKLTNVQAIRILVYPQL